MRKLVVLHIPLPLPQLMTPRTDKHRAQVAFLSEMTSCFAFGDSTRVRFHIFIHRHIGSPIPIFSNYPPSAFSPVSISFSSMYPVPPLPEFPYWDARHTRHQICTRDQICLDLEPFFTLVYIWAHNGQGCFPLYVPGCVLLLELDY